MVLKKSWKNFIKNLKKKKITGVKIPKGRDLGKTQQKGTKKQKKKKKLKNLFKKEYEKLAGSTSFKPNMAILV